MKSESCPNEPDHTHESYFQSFLLQPARGISGYMDRHYLERQVFVMMHKLVKYLDSKFGFEKASAHCDIPCGIYDPRAAQMAALTVVRMMDLMKALNEKSATMDLSHINTMSRYIASKEEHAEMVKREIRVIWGDFFKKEHFDRFPEMHDLVHEIMQLGSQARQSADLDKAEMLLDRVNRFAEIFWEIKGVKTICVVSPYLPERLVVHPMIEGVEKERLKKAS